jgi:glutamine synthetase
MSKTRFNALSAFSSRPKLNVELPAEKISDFFASAVFGNQQMKEFLPSDAYKRLAACIKDGKKVDRDIADQVASAMKAWAMKQGATHYTHWFQPLTGTTAEKHDSFFMPKGTEVVLKNLVQMH